MFLLACFARLLLAFCFPFAYLLLTPSALLLCRSACFAYPVFSAVRLARLLCCINDIARQLHCHHRHSSQSVDPFTICAPPRPARPPPAICPRRAPRGPQASSPPSSRQLPARRRRPGPSRARGKTPIAPCHALRSRRPRLPWGPPCSYARPRTRATVPNTVSSHGHSRPSRGRVAETRPDDEAAPRLDNDSTTIDRVRQQGTHDRARHQQHHAQPDTQAQTRAMHRLGRQRRTRAHARARTPRTCSLHAPGPWPLACLHISSLHRRASILRLGPPTSRSIRRALAPALARLPPAAREASDASCRSREALADLTPPLPAFFYRRPPRPPRRPPRPASLFFPPLPSLAPLPSPSQPWRPSFVRFRSCVRARVGTSSYTSQPTRPVAITATAIASGADVQQCSRPSRLPRLPPRAVVSSFFT